MVVITYPVVGKPDPRPRTRRRVSTELVRIYPAILAPTNRPRIFYPLSSAVYNPLAMGKILFGMALCTDSGVCPSMADPRTGGV